MTLGDVIARLAVSLTLETAAFEEGATIAEKRMAQSEKRFTALGKRMSSFGKTLSLAVTAPIVAFGVKSVQAAKESSEAMGQVNAALEHMGNAAGRTGTQLQFLARNLMHQSLYDDDEILRKVTANLLTFGRVSGDNFDKAEEAIVNLSSRMKTDLQTSTILIGKALNDPIKGLTALRRVGIQFTDEQKEQIKTMTEAGNIAGAQAVMLKELGRQFGGSAKAMRDANPTAALKNSFDDFSELVGGKLLPLIPRIANAIGGLLDAFDKLSPSVQTAIIVGAGLAAVFGPILVAVGGLIQVMAPLIAGVTTLFGVIGEAAAVGGTFSAVLAGWAAGLGSVLVSLAPFIAGVAALAAVGYEIYQNWDKIAPIFTELWAEIQKALGPALTSLMAEASAAFKEIANSDLVALFEALGSIIGNLALVLLKAFGGAIPGLVQAFGAIIKGVADVILDAVRFVVAVLDGDWNRAWQAAYDFFSDIGRAIIGVASGLAAAVLGAMSGMAKGIADYIQGKIGSTFKWLGEQIDMVKGWFFGLYDAVVGHSYIPDMVSGIGAEMAKLDALMTQPAQKATKKTKDAFKDMASDIQNVLDRLFPEQAAELQFRKEQALLGNIKDPGARQQALLALANERDLSRTNTPIAAPVDFGNETLIPQIGKLQDALDGLGKKSVETTVKVSKSFKDMANDTLNSLKNLTSAIQGGGFLNILGAVINLGLQLGSIGAFGKTIQTNINKSVPSYAGGTSFHPGGLALVGERGPELVNMPRGSSVTPNGAWGPTQIQVIPSPYFQVAVDGRIIQASPGIMDGGASLAQSRSTRAQTRRLA